VQIQRRAAAAVTAATTAAAGIAARGALHPGPLRVMAYLPASIAGVAGVAGVAGGV
jgi:hypothetical protein